jgi:hypothetical protein
MKDSLYQECLGVSEIGESRVLGGIPGFYTFENLWFHQGAFRKSGLYPKLSMLLISRPIWGSVPRAEPDDVWEDKPSGPRC